MPKISTSVKLKGFTQIQNKIEFRYRRFLREKKNIFEDPLKRTLSNIRKRLKKDTQAGGINHVYTGRMLNSVGSNSDSPTEGTMTILFGTFVPYGRVFELGGKPRFVPFHTLSAWSQHRFGSVDPAKPIQRSIQKKGTRSYPIVQLSWQGGQKNYLDIVHKRFWKVWSR